MRPAVTSSHNVLWLLLAALASFTASAQEKKNMPAYMAYRTDPVQKEYSGVLLGFAIDKKCHFLTPTVQADYERHLNSATELFRGYVLAKGMAPNPGQALKYPEEMALGAMRFAAGSFCDAGAEELVNHGQAAARDFQKVLGEPSAK